MEQTTHRTSEEGESKINKHHDVRSGDGGEVAVAAQGLGPANADYDIETVERVYRLVLGMVW